MNNLRGVGADIPTSNLKIKELSAIEAVFKENGFTKENGIDFCLYWDMGGWQTEWGVLENGQECFGVLFRNKDDVYKIKAFSDNLSWLTYITEMCAEDEEGDLYDVMYCVDNAAFASYNRRRKIQGVLKD